MFRTGRASGTRVRNQEVIPGLFLSRPTATTSARRPAVPRFRPLPILPPSPARPAGHVPPARRAVEPQPDQAPSRPHRASYADLTWPIRANRSGWTPVTERIRAARPNEAVGNLQRPMWGTGWFPPGAVVGAMPTSSWACSCGLCIYGHAHEDVGMAPIASLHQLPNMSRPGHSAPATRRVRNDPNAPAFCAAQNSWACHAVCQPAGRRHVACPTSAAPGA
jgi:hypothetical protein